MGGARLSADAMETCMSIERSSLAAKLRIPLMAGPMFLLTGPDLVIACARAGIVGAMPSLNARTPEILDTWLTKIDEELEKDRKAGKQLGLPALNIIVHHTNDRYEPDLAVCIKHRVPIVVAAIGSPARIIAPVHSYGGIVISDVSTVAHARKAAAAGVDGLILLCGGAGGNTGRINPFAFVSEVRRFFDGPIGVAGAVADGRSLRAIEIVGADFGYAGTPFIASRESQAERAYQEMVVEAGADDIEQSSDISGIPANFLKKSLDKYRALLDAKHGDFDLTIERENMKRWKDIWSAGHGVGSIRAIESVSEIVDRYEKDYCAMGGKSNWR
jgi:nitronate monooxygenase